MKSDINRTGQGKRGISEVTIIGYFLLIFGVLNIINFFSPIPIPTVGTFALVMGGLCIAIALFLLSLNEPRVLSLPNRILKLAQLHNGILTVPLVAVELDIPLKKAERTLNDLAKKGYAIMRLSSEEDGVIIYEFPEFRRED